MLGTLGFKDGNLLIGNNEWSDFRPNTGLAKNLSPPRCPFSIKQCFLDVRRDGPKDERRLEDSAYEQ